jgi:hypothetical protein
MGFCVLQATEQELLLYWRHWYVNAWASVAMLGIVAGHVLLGGACVC